jgi:hypothetical protein
MPANTNSDQPVATGASELTPPTSSKKLIVKASLIGKNIRFK